MRDADERRRKARLYRRLASVPTEGGHVANRALEILAARLEAEDVEDTIAVDTDDGPVALFPGCAPPRRHPEGEALNVDRLARLKGAFDRDQVALPIRGE
jgi:hypothetical protein